jgi:membrane protein implicated in regulation of membrane protease activity
MRLDWSDVAAVAGALCLLLAIHLQVGLVGTLAGLGVLLIVLALWLARLEASRRFQAKQTKQE